MGAPNVQVCGNVKFDLAPDPALLARGRGWRASDSCPVVLAASTREGEEAGLLVAWRQAMTASQVDGATMRPRLFIVPRHPQRFDEVAQAVLAAGFTLSRRSSWPASGPDAAAHAADVWLGDSMGEMPAYYAAADVALLGGSFAPLGGQNLIEAAACGCPVVMGPSTFNFAQAAELSEAAGAAWRVQDWPAGVAQALALTHPEPRREATARALAFAVAHRGAACQMAEAIWEVARR